MSKKDRLNKEIDSLREKRQNIFNIMLTLMSGIVVVLYAVLSGEKPIFLFSIAIFGIMILAWLGSRYSFIDDKIETKLDELENEE